MVFGYVRYVRGLGYIRKDSMRRWVISESAEVLGKVWFLEAMGNIGSMEVFGNIMFIVRLSNIRFSGDVGEFEIPQFVG